VRGALGLFAFQAPGSFLLDRRHDIILLTLSGQKEIQSRASAAFDTVLKKK
jgi:hypothetical protein